MAYCRFSSYGFQCDLYVYDSAEGVAVHIAKNRIVFASPLPQRPPVEFGADTIKQYLEYHQTVKEIIDASSREPITLPHAGTSHVFGCRDEAGVFIQSLRDLGYWVPESLPADLFEN